MGFGSGASNRLKNDIVAVGGNNEAWRPRRLGFVRYAETWHPWDTNKLDKKAFTGGYCTRRAENSWKRM